MNTTRSGKAVTDDEFIVIVPAAKHKNPPFVGFRGRDDWTYSFTGLKTSTLYRIQIELASTTKVSSLS